MNTAIRRAADARPRSYDKAINLWGEASNAHNEVTIDLKQEDLDFNNVFNWFRRSVTVGTAASLVDATILASIRATARDRQLQRRRVGCAKAFRRLRGSAQNAGPRLSYSPAGSLVMVDTVNSAATIAAHKTRVHQSSATSLSDRCGGHVFRIRKPAAVVMVWKPS